LGFGDDLAVALDFAAKVLVAGRFGAGFGAMAGLLAFFMKVLLLLYDYNAAVSSAAIN
jgi:hypothetical protein